MASVVAVGAVRGRGIHHWHNYRCRRRRQKAVGLRSVLAGGPHMRRREFITLLGSPH
jgi:hypothetical protein